MNVHLEIEELYPSVDQEITIWFNELTSDGPLMFTEILYEFWRQHDYEIGVACSPVDGSWYWQLVDGSEVTHSEDYWDSKKEAEKDVFLHLAEMMEEFPDDMEIRLSLSNNG